MKGFTAERSRCSLLPVEPQSGDKFRRAKRPEKRRRPPAGAAETEHNDKAGNRHRPSLTHSSRGSFFDRLPGHDLNHIFQVLLISDGVNWIPEDRVFAVQFDLATAANDRDGLADFQR